jgi:uncharacterized membrane protein YeaQ/YmgE (transglycosylase-associated protein family)
MGFLVLWIIFGVVTGVIAASKGRSGFGWFLIGCVLGIFGLILVAVMPSLKPQAVTVTNASDNAPRQVSDSRPTKSCPECGETVLQVANVCKHCGARFSGITVSSVSP